MKQSDEPCLVSAQNCSLYPNCKQDLKGSQFAMSDSKISFSFPKLSSNPKVVNFNYINLAAQTLPITVTCTDGKPQMCEALNREQAEDLAEALKSGQLEPPDVFYEGLYDWSSDGDHPIKADLIANHKKIAVNVLHGIQRDAILHWIQKNAAHNVFKHSRAEKRRAAEVLLRDEEWSQWSDNAIATICQLDHKTVARLRRNLGLPKLDVRKCADGCSRSTSKIGGSKKAAGLSPQLDKEDTETELTRHNTDNSSSDLDDDPRTQTIYVKAVPVEESFSATLRQSKLKDGSTELATDVVCTVFTSAVSAFTDDQIQIVWQAISPRVSSKMLPLETYSNAELERIIENAQQELSWRCSYVD